MLGSVGNYIGERRKGLATTVGLAGALYLAGQYAMDRLQEMREQVVHSQKDKDNLRRRFLQSQEDISFTVMTHLPTLSKAILNDMDVERVTQELQKRSRNARGRIPAHISDSEQTHSESSLTSSMEFGLEAHDARSDVLSAAESDASALDHIHSAVEESGVAIPYPASASTTDRSWVHEFNTQVAGSSRDPSSSRLSTSSRGPYTNLDSPRSSAAYLSDSFMSDSIASASASERDRSVPRQSRPGIKDLFSFDNKSKADLWKEVKVLSFTRTLTIIYSTVLLTLLTTIQLTIIGRSNYIQSVVQLCRDEKNREHTSFESSLFSLFFHESPSSEEVQDVEGISDSTEQKFLVLSWWLLYVGWKDMGERVRRSVEEVFEGVSLKTQLGPLELHRLICDARRRVEHEVTYEGTERRINFLSSVIPPTPETLSLVLGEGGIPGFSKASSSHPQATSRDPYSDPRFRSLLSEVQGAITSPAFEHVLEASLDRATDVLFDGLRRNMFTDVGEGGSPEKMRLASLLPGLARWGRLSLNSMPNEIVDNVLNLKETTALSAIIYSNFDTRLQ